MKIPMLTPRDLEDRMFELIRGTFVEEGKDGIYWVRDEYFVKIASFYSFVEAYRYRLAYVASKLESEK